MNFIDRIPADKAHHFILGVIASLVKAITAALLGIPNPNMIGAVAGVFIGIAKEVRDWLDNRKLRSMKRHGVEFYDFLATALGALVPLIGQLLS